MGGPAPFPDELKGTPRPSGQFTVSKQRRRRDLSDRARVIWLFAIAVPGGLLLLLAAWAFDHLRTLEIAAGVRVPGMWQ